MLILEILIISVIVSIFTGFFIRVGTEEKHKRFVPQGRANYIDGKWRVG